MTEICGPKTPIILRETNSLYTLVTTGFEPGLFLIRNLVKVNWAYGFMFVVPHCTCSAVHTAMHVAWWRAEAAGGTGGGGFKLDSSHHKTNKFERRSGDAMRTYVDGRHKTIGCTTEVCNLLLHLHYLTLRVQVYIHQRSTQPIVVIEYASNCNPRPQGPLRTRTGLSTVAQATTVSGSGEE